MLSPALLKRGSRAWANPKIEQIIDLQTGNWPIGIIEG